MPIAPSGELTSLGVAAESSYGSAVTPTTFLICSDTQFQGANEYLERTGARKRIGRTKPKTGMFMGKASLTAEADPDNIGALLLATLGAETIAANAANPGTSATVATTLTNPVSIGFATVVVGSLTGITNGASLTIDTAGNAETVVVKDVQTNNSSFSAYFTKQHAAGAAVANAAVVNAYDHTFTLGSPRKSLTAQLNRVLDAINFVGCKVSQLGFSITEKAILEAKASLEYQNELAVTGTPTTPTYSTLYPFGFEDTGNAGKVNGVQSDADIMDFTFDVNTGLITDFPAFGKGRFRQQMPETVTKVSGSMNLAFETETMYQLFWGAPGSSGPRSLVLPVALEFDFVSTENVNAAVPYSLKFIMGTCQLTADDVPTKAADYLKQAVKWESYESVNGAGDDIKAVLTNASLAASL